MKHRLIIPLSLITLIIACSGDIQMDYVYEMTSEKAERHNMPGVDFKISYPDSIIALTLESYKSDSHYVIFKNKERDESLSIGSLYGLTGDSASDDITLMNFINQIYFAYGDSYGNGKLSNFQMIHKGKKDFLDRDAFQFICSYDKLNDQSISEHWMDRWVLITNENHNGVSLAFQANNHNKQVKSALELGIIGYMADIWKTFEFTN